MGSEKPFWEKPLILIIIISVITASYRFGGVSYGYVAKCFFSLIFPKDKLIERVIYRL
jgi:hypothetical protein